MALALGGSRQPAIVQRQDRPGLLAILLFCGSLLLVRRFWDDLWGAGPTSVVEWIVAGALFFAPVAIIQWVSWRARRRLRRLVETRSGAVCTLCGYDLAHSSDDGLCPECGEAYAMRELRLCWRRAGLLPEGRTAAEFLRLYGSRRPAAEADAQGRAD